MIPIAIFSKGRAELLLKNKDHILAQAVNGYVPTYLIVPHAEYAQYKDVAAKFECQLFTTPVGVTTLYEAYTFFIKEMKDKLDSQYLIIADDDITVYNKTKSKIGMRMSTSKVLMMDECAEAFESAMTNTGAAIAGLLHTNNALITKPFYKANKRLSSIYCIALNRDTVNWDWGHATYGECALLLKLLNKGELSISLTNYMFKEAFSAARRVGGKHTYVTEAMKYQAAKALKEKYPESVALKELPDRITLALYLKKDYGGGHGI